MIKYQKNIYKTILAFSILVNILVFAILFFILKDSLSGNGIYVLEGKNFWYFVGVILAYSLVNTFFVINLFKNQTTFEE